MSVPAQLIENIRLGHSDFSEFLTQAWRCAEPYGRDDLWWSSVGVSTRTHASEQGNTC